ncbi:hypothetical protein WA158_004820 [Blastocystis sp. Blastoise]
MPSYDDRGRSVSKSESRDRSHHYHHRSRSTSSKSSRGSRDASYDREARYSRSGSRRHDYSRKRVDPNQVDEKTLTECFSHYGNVESVSVIRDPEGYSRGFGFLTFTDPSAAKEATQQDILIRGIHLSVALSKRCAGYQPNLGRATNRDRDSHSYSSHRRRYDSHDDRYRRSYDRRDSRDYYDRRDYDRRENSRDRSRSRDRSYGRH